MPIVDQGFLPSRFNGYNNSAAFIAQCTNYLNYKCSEEEEGDDSFDDFDDAVDAMGCLLQGSAAVWFMNWRSNNPNEGWEEFSEQFMNTFAKHTRKKREKRAKTKRVKLAPEEASRLRTEFLELRQTNDTTVEALTQKFESMICEVPELRGMSQGYRADTYTAKLRPKIRDQVRDLKPRDLEQAIAYAKKAEVEVNRH